MCIPGVRTITSLSKQMERKGKRKRKINVVFCVALAKKLYFFIASFPFFNGGFCAWAAEMRSCEC